jgi:hypothetical protein
MVLNLETEVAEAVRRELLCVDVGLHKRNADSQDIDLLHVVHGEEETPGFCDSIGVIIVEHTSCGMLILHWHPPG